MSIEWKIVDSNDYFYSVAGPGGGTTYYLDSNQEYQSKVLAASETILNYYKSFAEQQTFDNGDSVTLKFVSTGIAMYYNLVATDGGTRTYILDEFHIYYKVTNYWPDMSIINVVAIDNYIINCLGEISFIFEGEEINPTIPDLPMIPETEEEQNLRLKKELIDKLNELNAEFVVQRNKLLKVLKEQEGVEYEKFALGVKASELTVDIDLDGSIISMKYMRGIALGYDKIGTNYEYLFYVDFVLDKTPYEGLEGVVFNV